MRCWRGCAGRWGFDMSPPLTMEVKVCARLERKDPRLPVYVLIPARRVDRWRLAGTTVIEGTANGWPFGRRTIKAWGKGSGDWFVEFTASFCSSAGLNVGDHVALALRLADASTPVELENILARDRNLAVAWQALSDRQRRDAGEHVRAAKTPATRQRRAASTVDAWRRQASQPRRI